MTRVICCRPRSPSCSSTAGGPPTPRAYAAPDDAALVRAFGALVTARRVNDQNSALVRQGRMAVYPSSHGQEACQVAAALCLAEGDWMFPTYRDSVAVMARGVDPVQTMTFRGDWHSGYDPPSTRWASSARR